MNEESSLHKIVSPTRQALKEAHVDSRGILIRPRGQHTLDIRVSKKMLDRAIRIMNAFIVKIESEGITAAPEVTRTDCEDIRANVFGQNVNFAIVERSAKRAALAYPYPVKLSAGEQLPMANRKLVRSFVPHARGLN